MCFPLLALGRVSSCLGILRMLECGLEKLCTRKEREGGRKVATKQKSWTGASPNPLLSCRVG